MLVCSEAPSFFGSTQMAQPQMSSFAPTQALINQSASLNVAGLQQAMIEAQLSALPYGDSPLLKMSIPLQKDKGAKKPALDLRYVNGDQLEPERILNVYCFSAQRQTPGSATRPVSTPSIVSMTSPATPKTSSRLPVAGANLDSSLNSSFTYKPLFNLPYAGFGAPLGLGPGVTPSILRSASRASRGDNTSLRERQVGKTCEYRSRRLI